MSKAKDKHLIIGAGEVGTALYNVLKSVHEVSIRDKEKTADGTYDVLHIAYPYQADFVTVTQEYIEEYRPELTVIYSTVPVGTTRLVAEEAVHSPIRGVHPNLEKGIKVFRKYFGGFKARETAIIFSKAGVWSMAFAKPETTELLKILDTTYYGWNIVFCKEVKRICDAFGLSFNEVYTIPNEEYNFAYKELGMGHVTRPVLTPMPGPIGGHCVVPNCDLLEAWLTKVIKERNKVY